MKPLVGVIMGSRSDWSTMTHATETLTALGVPFEVRVVSAHRTPDLLFEYAGSAVDRGLEVLIAGAGGAAHLPGMTAAKTRLPVIGVPVRSRSLQGIDSLLSIVQMPRGIPVATVAIGKSGAVNAALLAAAILANKHSAIATALEQFRAKQTAEVLEQPDSAQRSLTRCTGATLVDDATSSWHRRRRPTRPYARARGLSARHRLHSARYDSRRPRGASRRRRAAASSTIRLHSPSSPSASTSSRSRSRT